MSAICGLFHPPSKATSNSPELEQMLRALQRRGPGRPSVFASEGGVCLAVRSGAARVEAQIYTNRNRTLVMVLDGEVFNRKEITDGLERRDRPGPGEGAGELLLNLFEEQGVEGFKRVDGQFALAIWDKVTARLTLARDFLGVVPLYYAPIPGGVGFASEIKALLQHPQIGRSYDLESVARYLTFLNVPGPGTLIEGVFRLLPGHTVTVDAAGNLNLSRYWDLLDNPIREREEPSFYIEQTRVLHRQAVQRRVSGGPVGALLSGGNDSSANAVVIARSTSGPLHTFTVGLADTEGLPAYSDLEYAQRVAKLVGSEHHELLLNVDQFLESIPIVVDALDDLVSEPSAIFLHAALNLAREAGMKTIITGEANDELCCGHGEMIAIRNGYYKRWIPYMRLPAVVRRWAARVGPLYSRGHRDILQRAARGSEYFWNFEIAWAGSEVEEVITPSAISRIPAGTAEMIVTAYKSQFLASEHAQRDYLDYMIYLMMQDFYFGNLMLGKLDLLSRSLGLEARCPYTEPNYARFVYNVPAQYKLKDGTVKWFFKKAIEALLPREIIYRPKQGFRTPIVELFRGRLGDWARPYLMEGGFTSEGLIRRQHIERLLRDHGNGSADFSNKLWTLLMLNLWHQRWLAS